MRVFVLAGVLVAAVAQAGPKTLAVSAGDCGAVSEGMAKFEAALKARLQDDLWDAELVLTSVRPNAARSVEELKRQIDSARTLFYAGQPDKALDLVRQAVTDLERVSPKLAPFPVLADAFLVQALVHRSTNRKAELTEAFRRVLRVDPAFQPDTNFFTPAFVQAFDAARKELQRAKKVALQIQSQPAGAEVFIDGQSMGRSPLRAQLPPGEYSVSLVNEVGLSFLHKVRLGAKDESLIVDLSYEAAVSTRVPLCLALADDVAAKAAAAKLGAAIGADRFVLLRLVSKSGEPPRFRAVLVVGAEEERGGEVRQAALPDLAEFMVTGKTQPGLIVPGAAPAATPPPVTVPVPVAMPAPPKPPAPAPPASPAAPAASPPDVATTPVRSESVAAPPASISTAAPAGPRQLSPTGVAGIGLLAGGAVTGVVGLVHFLVATRPAQVAFEALFPREPGLLPTNSTEASRAEALQAGARVASSRLLSFALLGAGAGIAAAGGLLLALFPATKPVVSAALTQDGGLLVFSGSLAP